MREFKFRAWERVSFYSSEKTMHYFDFLDVHRSGYSDVQYHWDFKDSPIMQYVGITDSEGKEVCECDIVSYSYQSSKDADSAIISKKDIVEWDENYCGFQPFLYMETYYVKPIDLKIIGNIYENPELLNELWGIE